jgi:hypothetical protein
MAVSVALAAAGAGFGDIVGGSALIVAALTLAIGFAAQDVISNFAAGVFIVYDPNFKLGSKADSPAHRGRGGSRHPVPQTHQLLTITPIYLSTRRESQRLRRK